MSPQSEVVDEIVEAFVNEVRAALLRGDRHKTPGFGTFTTCSRKAAPGREACTMAMFRASKELRAQVSDSSVTEVGGAHAKVVSALAAAMQRDEGVDVPRLGHLGVVRVPGKKPRLVFHAASELNTLLTANAGPS